MAVVSVAIVTAAIFLWVDLLFDWSEKHPVRARQVIGAFVLMIAIAVRIMQRLSNGSL